MYRLSPFTYLVSGMLSVGLANSSVQCADNEFVLFEPPSDRTCGQYIAQYKQTFVGYMDDPEARSGCRYCSIEDTNVFLRSISSDYSQAWRNFGILWAFVIFNVVAALVLYWLVRMPKPKKEKGDKKAVGGHKGAVKEQALDNPSNVGSRTSDIGQEKSAQPTRYASITGATTPPRQEISEKV